MFYKFFFFINILIGSDHSDVLLWLNFIFFRQKTAKSVVFGVNGFLKQKVKQNFYTGKNLNFQVLPEKW